MNYVVIFIFICALFLPTHIHANEFIDEFGDRFYNQAPEALGDYTVPKSEDSDIAMDKVAEELQEVIPAAGNKDTDSDTSIE